MWIGRTLEPIVATGGAGLGLFPVWLLLGPRQVGKKSLLKRFPGRSYISLDDLDTRRRANEDPELFVQSLTLPFLIDEIQYAPRLLSPIKRIADSGVPAGSVWLTGSQNFSVMKGVQESLAGRVAILNLLGLSDEEKRLLQPLTPADYFATLHRSSFPKICSSKDENYELYLSSYQQTYLERDVQELIGIQRKREFEIFLKMCALRTGQLLNISDLARDSGISPNTAKSWLSVLEGSFVIKLVYPFYSNRIKRLVKLPKLYFLDAGLAAFIGGWREPEAARLGPLGGALLETHIFGEIIRYFRHRIQESEISFFRTRDGEEIDFLVECQGRIYPIEVKMGQPSANDLASVKKYESSNWGKGTVLALSQLGRNRAPLSSDWDIASPLELPQIFSD